MADLSSSGLLLLLWTAIMVSSVPPASPQPPPPLSLPVKLSVVSPPWQLLALSQGEPGPLFYNSSPFSVSQSVFLLPPPGLSAAPGLKASFGPYSVTQLVPEPFRPASPNVRASLLSENVEREMDEGGREVFRVRALFRLPGDAGARGTCVLLHAFRETEQRRASCVTQPLGLCVVTLTLPGEWFQAQDQRPGPDAWQKKALRGRRAQSRRHGNHVHPLRARAPPPRSHPVSEADSHPDRPAAFRHQRGPGPNQIQLYYSSFSPEADLQLTQTRCEEESLAQSQRQMYHIRAVTLPEQTEVKGRPQEGIEGIEGCLGGQQAEELSVDSHVTVRYHRGPVLIGQPVRMSVSLRGNFSADFVVIRMKVKKGLVSMTAQRTLTSDQWTVSLERSQSSKHDVMTIVCHKPPTHQPPLQQQVVCLSVDGLRRSFGVAMTVAATWWVEYSGQSRLTGTADSAFSFSDRPIVGIVPVTESDQILNTAILTSRPVSLPVAVLAVGHDQKVSDVTSAVTCRSANENTVKVSSDCSAVFVDGSESGLGNTCAEVHFELGVLSGSVCLEVWAPSVPLQVLLTDPVLNAIDGWNLFTEERCVPVYQRSSLQVLTQFTARDRGGRPVHLLGSSDLLVDVTDLVHGWLRVADPQVALLGPQNTLIGLQPGKTSLHVVSDQWDGVLGECDVTVSAEAVAPGDLSVQVVGGLSMSLQASPASPSVVTATVTASNILSSYHQEAFVSVWIQFSDDTASLLSSFEDLPSLERLSSLADSVVVVTPGPGQRIFARGDGGGPLLQAELLVPACGENPPSLSTRRLARGSGWVRVNLDLDPDLDQDLDLDPLRPERGPNEDDEEFEFDVSDLLFESNNEIYAPNQHGGRNGTKETVRRRLADRGGGRQSSSWTGGGNTLEKAVLLPILEEGSVYFSPSLEAGGGQIPEGGGGGGGRGAPEMEVGLGAVLALLGLSAVLFLANCLPCTLRDRRGAKGQQGGEGGVEAGPTGDHGDPGRESEGEGGTRGVSEGGDLTQGEEREDRVQGEEIFC